MNSIYDFIVKPVDKRYNNTKIVNNKKLILNTSIENFKAISTEAIVVAIPLAYNQPINVGDKIIIHHNVFRRWYDMKGKEKNSRSYFKEDLYFCSIDQIYLYKQDKWKAFGERCFVIPTKNKDTLSNQKTQKQEGIVKYCNEKLNELGIYTDDLISFKPEREFEFVIDNELLYCMKSKDIVVKHERKGNEEKYNPSWATSSEGINQSSEGTDCRYRGGCDCGPTKERSCHQEVSDF